MRPPFTRRLSVADFFKRSFSRSEIALTTNGSGKRYNLTSTSAPLTSCINVVISIVKSLPW